MMRLDTKLLPIAIWIIATITSVECLMCVSCTSLENRQCISGKMAPKNCSITAKYCTKYEGTVKLTQSKLVKRDCSDEMEKPGCRDMVLHERDVRICYTACQTDGCNTGTCYRPNVLITFIISVFCIKYKIAQ